MLEKEISVLKPKAEQVLKLRSERDKIIALRAQVIGLKKAALPPVAILSKLSELLDDQTFLFDMRMEGAAVTMSGLSSDASKLAQRLGAIEAFKSVKFSGPVLRDPQSARDRFTLILEMAATIMSECLTSAWKKGRRACGPAVFGVCHLADRGYSASLPSS